MGFYLPKTRVFTQNAGFYIPKTQALPQNKGCYPPKKLGLPQEETFPPIARDKLIPKIWLLPKSDFCLKYMEKPLG